MNDFIVALFDVNDKMKASTVYQILIGKKTSSVLCYAYFHDLLPYFSLFPDLKKETFIHSLQNSSQEKKIRIDSEGQVLRLEKTAKLQSIFPNLDSFKWGRTAEKCWRMLQLFVQAVSNLDKSKDYQPIETSPLYTEPVRKMIRENRETVAVTLYQELTNIFKQMPHEKADFLASSFSGYEQNGQVFFQLVPAKFEKEPWTKCYTNDSIHLFLAWVVNDKNTLLYHLLRSLLIQNESQSMLHTIQLAKKGHTVEQIMQIRHLKQGTIHDHLIEWALQDPHFPYENFVTQAQWQKLQSLPERSWELSYQQLVEERTVSFLELRLYQIYQKGGGSC